jgi:hypothetical protein
VSEELVRLVAHAGKMAWDNTLVGNPAPMIEERGRRMRMPMPGDLVLETTTYHRAPFVGWLEEMAEEPIGDEGATEPVYYVRSLLDGVTQRWVNATFAAWPANSPDLAALV